MRELRVIRTLIRLLALGTFSPEREKEERYIRRST
jgi:hypothetical protein